MAARGGYLFTATLVLTSLASCVRSETLPAQVAPSPPQQKRLALPKRVLPLGLPRDVVLAGRWRNPSALLGQLSTWAGGAQSFEPWLRARLGRPAHPIDLSAPIELLVVLDRHTDPPSLSWALSLGLSASVVAGAVDATSSVSPRDVESPSGLACAEASSLGHAPLRMVCAASDDHLARLLPHATRALPHAALGEADVALSLYAEPLAEVDDPSLHSLVSAWLAEASGVPRMNARFDAEWSGVVTSLTHELRHLAQDLDGSSIEFSLSSREEALELSIVAPAAAGRSTLGQLIVGSGASGLAPADFWHAHEASEDAGYIWAFESTPLARLRQPLAELLGTVLDFRGVPDRLQQQARELLLMLPLPHGPVIHASGRLPARDGARPAARAPWLDELGWQLYSVRGNFAEYQFYVPSLVKAFSDPILGPQFGRLFRGALGDKWVPLRLRQRRLGHGPELARGSFVLEVTFAGPAVAGAPEGNESTGGVRGAPLPTLFVVFAPDEDDGVKIAWGADEKFLVSLVSEPRRVDLSTTLANRAGLGSLHDHRTLAGGFYSLAAFDESNRSSLARLGLWGGTAVANAPHRGLSPIVYALSQPSATTLSLTARLARDTLEDLLFLISVHAPSERAE